jgi:hypothetical protein
VLLLKAKFCEHCIRLPRCFPGFPKFPHPCGGVNEKQPEALAFSTQSLGRKLLLEHPWIRMLAPRCGDVTTVLTDTLAWPLNLDKGQDKLLYTCKHLLPGTWLCYGRCRL